MLVLARRVLDQKQHQRGPKVYFAARAGGGVHRQGQGAPALRVRVKVSIATTLAHACGGQFVTHVKALAGNPYDGHTLATVIPDMETRIGNTIERILADKGYRGHNAPPGNAINAVLAATGYNFRRLIRWLALLLRQILAQLTGRLQLVG
jgi:hypothetical protein